jgi:CDP-glucose 4,6-dehydratase
VEDLVSADWPGRRVLVTGATGIIGSWLTSHLLDRGADVTALVLDADSRSQLVRSRDIDRITVVQGRLESYDDVERAIVGPAVDTVFHLGAQAIVGTALSSPRATFETNIRGTYNVLDACRLHRDLVRHVVIASSDKAYGSSPILPYTEDQPPLGRHPYDVSKSCTDLLATSYAMTYELPVAIARCGNVYGGGDLHWNRVVPGTIRALLEDRSPEVRSDGSYTRDYIHVDDIAEAYIVLAENLHQRDLWGEAFNFSPGEPVTVLELIAEITSVIGSNREPVILDIARAEIPHQYLDPSKAERLLGWRSQIDLEEGLARTVSWYRDYLSA